MSEHNSIPSPRVPDKLGHIPRHGAITDYARSLGVARITVLAALRRGALRVAANGAIEAGAPDPSRPAPQPRKGTGRVKTLDIKPAHGALTRARARYGLGIRQTYLRIADGLLIVDPISREIVRAEDVTASRPALRPRPVEPNAATDLAQQRAAIKRLAMRYIANAIAAGITIEDAGNGIVSDLRCLMHDCQ